MSIESIISFNCLACQEELFYTFPEDVVIKYKTNLKYSHKTTPIEIAERIIKKKITCTKCNKKFIITDQPYAVSLYLRPEYFKAEEI